MRLETGPKKPVPAAAASISFETTQEKVMEPRLNSYEAASDAMRALTTLETTVRALGIDPRLLDLIKLRASQINGCAYCVDMHAGDLRKAGETSRRIDALSVWRDTPFFTVRERAALAWTEAITLISETHAPDEDYEMLKSEFSEREMANITLAIATINCWNRVSVGFRKMPTA
ncbi:MAG: carboxymuconolactone decarboxylase family protein [Nitrosospira sp.]